MNCTLLSLSTSGMLMTSGAFTPSATFAADATSAGATDSGALDEIVVTANKRSQNLQDVAKTATVLGETQLAEQKVNTLADIASDPRTRDHGVQMNPTKLVK